MPKSKAYGLTEEQQADLLGRITAATAKSAADSAAAEKEHRAVLAKARRPRATAIIHALNVGVPRADVAAAAGVKMARMYQIINDSKRT